MSALEKLKKAVFPTVEVKQTLDAGETPSIETLQEQRIEKIIPQQILLLTQRTSVDDSVDSSSTGDNDILIGEFGKVFEITKITSFHVTGTRATYKFEKHTRAGFLTQRAISADDSLDKESETGLHIEFGDKIVLNVTAGGASSFVDVVISYNVYIFKR